jgi:hypothetical protein
VPTYKDPAAVTLDNGRTMADNMRRGPYGLRGVVVGRATPGGTPENYDPHDMAGTAINFVDQQGNKIGSFTVDKLNSPAARKAAQQAKLEFPGNDIDAIRNRAARSFELLAGLLQDDPAAPQELPDEEEVVVSAPPPLPADEQEIVDVLVAEKSAQLPLDKIDRNYSPMAAFGLKKDIKKPAVSGGDGSSRQKAGPPQKLVYFEKEGIGTVPAFFHDILLSISPVDDDELEHAGFLVLVYDLRFEQNAARWFPPSNDPYQRPWALQITDEPRLYLVHTTGFQYVYDEREYCILLVEKSFISSGA